MIKKVILWILVIFWMGLIFYFSSIKGEESTGQSQGFIYNTIGNIVEFFNKDISIEEKELIIEKYDPIVRKVAHVGIYMILGLLVCLLINCYNVKLNKCIILSIIICIMYAISDEIHQTFVEGRSGEIKDIFIDSMGILIANVVFYLRRKNNE